MRATKAEYSRRYRERHPEKYKARLERDALRRKARMCGVPYEDMGVATIEKPQPRIVEVKVKRWTYQQPIALWPKALTKR